MSPFSYALLVCSLVSGCGNAARDCHGDEGCACYPNSTCNAALSCLSNLCVNAGGAGGSGTGGASTGGAAFELASNPAVWFRADDGVVESGGAVSRWLDRSGRGDDAVMGDPSREPSLVSNALNGLPVLHFSGAESLYLSTPFSAVTFSVFVVGRNSNPTEYHSTFLGPGGNTPNNQLRWESGSSILIVGLGNDLPETTVSIGSTRTYHVLGVRYDGQQLSVTRNARPMGTAQFFTTGPWILGQVGAWFSSDFMQGDLAEVVLYDRALTEAEFSGTSAQLSKKYAIQ